MRTWDIGHDDSHLISWHVELTYSLLECCCVYYYVNMALHVHLDGK